MYLCMPHSTTFIYWCVEWGFFIAGLILINADSEITKLSDDIGGLIYLSIGGSVLLSAIAITRQDAELQLENAEKFKKKIQQFLQ